jgi:hypothetical protein
MIMNQEFKDVQKSCDQVAVGIQLDERNANVQKSDRFGIAGLCCLRGWPVLGSDTERLS